MKEVEQAFTSLQIELAQKLKNVAESYEITRGFLLLNEMKPAVFGLNIEPGAAITINNQFNFGQ